LKDKINQHERKKKSLSMAVINDNFVPEKLKSALVCALRVSPPTKESLGLAAGPCTPGRAAARRPRRPRRAVGLGATGAVLPFPGGSRLKA